MFLGQLVNRISRVPILCNGEDEVKVRAGQKFKFTALYCLDWSGQSVRLPMSAYPPLHLV